MIYVTGDIHGDIDIFKLNMFNFPEGRKLSKNDYVIICGDFGLVWGGKEKNRDEYWQHWFERQPWTTLFIDGNHENHQLLNSYPVDLWHGGRVHYINKSIIHLMRGEIYEIEGKTFFAFGGGYSTDRHYRQTGISWWPEELPTHEEVTNASKHLQRYDYHVDYVLTHDAPRDIKEYLGFYTNCDMTVYDQRFEDIHSVLYQFKQVLDFQMWYLGHYHIDRQIGNMRILYDDIIQIL